MNSSVLLQEVDVSQEEALRAAIDEAWRTVSPCWPLNRLIACNPLKGLEEKPFATAVKEALGYHQLATRFPQMATVNRVTIKWNQVLFDQGQATLGMPGRSTGLWAGWRRLAPYDHDLHAGSEELQQWLKNLSAVPLKAITDCLNRLQVPTEQRAEFLKRLLHSLNGWSGYAKYHARWHAERLVGDDVEYEYLAIRLVIATCVWPGASSLIATSLPEPDIDPQLARLEAKEQEYASELLTNLLAVQNPAHEIDRPTAQFVFCIDVRSEPMRRALEFQEGVETYGAAGFYYAPVRIHDHEAGSQHPYCPPLLQAQHTVSRGKDRSFPKPSSVLKRVYESLKYAFISPFGLVEMAGPLLGLWLSLRTFFPSQAESLKQRLKSSIQPDAPASHLEFDDIPFLDRCAYAETLLRLIGLTKNFAPVIALCGHRSHSKNNPHSALLDCGACGGQPGGGNAELMAKILNSNDVRNELAKRGIEIPMDTHFHAAEHDTTENRLLPIQLQEGEPFPKTALACIEFAHIQLALTDGNQALASKAHDWSETRPEWGLARNAALIIGPRSVSQSVDLDGRAFLHSYNWQEDDSGAALEAIMGGPMVVAHWINSQYLFSSWQQSAFGSGSKVTQNVCGKFGVMQGNGSDLMHGLSLESVASSDAELFHTPQRLLSVIHAPPDRVLRLVQRNPDLKRLVQNKWTRVVCIDPQESTSWELHPGLIWKKISL